MLRLLLVLLLALILWVAFGKLDIATTAAGKLIPQTSRSSILEYLRSPVTGAFQEAER